MSNGNDSGEGVSRMRLGPTAFAIDDHLNLLLDPSCYGAVYPDTTAQTLDEEPSRTSSFDLVFRSLLSNEKDVNPASDSHTHFHMGDRPGSADRYVSSSDCHSIDSGSELDDLITISQNSIIDVFDSNSASVTPVSTPAGANPWDVPRLSQSAPSPKSQTRKPKTSLAGSTSSQTRPSRKRKAAVNKCSAGSDSDEGTPPKKLASTSSKRREATLMPMRFEVVPHDESKASRDDARRNAIKKLVDDPFYKYLESSMGPLKRSNFCGGTTKATGTSQCHFYLKSDSGKTPVFTIKWSHQSRKYQTFCRTGLECHQSPVACELRREIIAEAVLSEQLSGLSIFEYLRKSMVSAMCAAEESFAENPREPPEASHSKLFDAAVTAARDIDIKLLDALQLFRHQSNIPTAPRDGCIEVRDTRVAELLPGTDSNDLDFNLLAEALSEAGAQLHLRSFKFPDHTLEVDYQRTKAQISIQSSTQLPTLGVSWFIEKIDDIPATLQNQSHADIVGKLDVPAATSALLDTVHDDCLAIQQRLSQITKPQQQFATILEEPNTEAEEGRVHRPAEDSLTWHAMKWQGSFEWLIGIATVLLVALALFIGNAENRNGLFSLPSAPLNDGLGLASTILDWTPDWSARASQYAVCYAMCSVGVKKDRIGCDLRCKEDEFATHGSSLKYQENWENRNDNAQDREDTCSSSNNWGQSLWLLFASIPVIVSSFMACQYFGMFCNAENHLDISTKYKNEKNNADAPLVKPIPIKLEGVFHGLKYLQGNIVGNAHEEDFHEMSNNGENMARLTIQAHSSRDIMSTDNNVFNGQVNSTGDDTISVRVKILASDASSAARQALQAEATTLAQLQHQNVVGLLGTIISNRTFLMVLSSPNAENLNRILVGPGPELQVLLQYCLDICMAMEFIVAKKYVHRDLRTANIVVQNGSAKVGGFGLSRAATTKHGEYICPHNALVAVRWAAPETLLMHQCSEQSDVYSFGVTLCEIFTNGQLPYASWSNHDVITEVSGGFVVPPPSTAPDQINHEIIVPSMKRNFRRRPRFSTLRTQLEHLTRSFESWSCVSAGISKTSSVSKNKPASNFAPASGLSTVALCNDPDLDFHLRMLGRSDSNHPLGVALRQTSRPSADPSVAKQVKQHVEYLSAMSREYKSSSNNTHDLKIADPILVSLSSIRADHSIARSTIIDRTSFEFKRSFDFVGEGTTKVVYRACWVGNSTAKIESGDYVAAKCIQSRSRGITSADAELLTSISHNNIVQFFGMCQDGSNTYLIEEYCDGGSLQVYMQRRISGLDVKCIASWGTDIVNGLQYLHDALQSSHQDLKSSNLLISGDHLKLCDLGATLTINSGPSIVRTPENDIIVRTHRYTAPELFRGDKDCDLFKSDIYSVGVVLWEMLTATTPFVGVPDHHVSMMLGGANPEQLAIPYGTQPALRRLLTACMHSDPSSRPGLGLVLLMLEHLDIEPPGSPTSSGKGIETARNLHIRVEGHVDSPVLSNNKSTPDTADVGQSAADDLTVVQLENRLQRYQLWLTLQTLTIIIAIMALIFMQLLSL